MTAPDRINVFWSLEDECWIADLPDLEYCSAHGAGLAEAVAEVQVAMEDKPAADAAKGGHRPAPAT